MDLSELFWKASLEEMKEGVVYQADSDEFVCIICGQRVQNGIIYPEDNCLYEAGKFIKNHVRKQHGSTLDFLLNLDKKLTGLTEHQKKLIELFSQGMTDQEVARELGTGSTSTIRNHRFLLREKHKQAKVFFAIMELLEKKISAKNSFIDIPRSSRQVDERFAVTEEEQGQIIAAYFKQGVSGPLDLFPAKEKKRAVILKHILQRFQPDKFYTEKEVNNILKPIFEDYVMLRRYLIDYGFMGRKYDGSSYWVQL